MDGLTHELSGKVAYLYTVCDALAPRGLFEATYECQRFASLFDDPTAPTSTSEAFFSPSPADVYPAPAATLLRSEDQPA